MNTMSQEFRAAGRHMAANPAAIFVAVLTAGFAMASAAQHLGLYNAAMTASRRSNVVLACPRTSSAKSAAGHKTAQKAPATPARSTSESAESASSAPAATQNGASIPSVKPAAAKSGGLSVPLPDFNAPELSRFISPL